MGGAEGEALRRRVYARDADGRDLAALRRFRARRRRPLGVVAALAVAALLSLAALALRPPPDPVAAVGAALPVDGRVQRLAGTGPALVALDGGGAPDSGRVTVVFALSRDVRGGWTALRLGTDGSPVVVLRPVARRIGARAAGAASSARVRYTAGARPVRLRVDAPNGVRWAAAAVFSG